MAERTITVSKTAIVKSNQMEVKNAPKSRAGNRQLPITDELLPYLETWLNENKSPYVFPTTKGELMTDTASRRMWEKILSALNLAAGGNLADDITPHIFRNPTENKIQTLRQKVHKQAELNT